MLFRELPHPFCLYFHIFVLFFVSRSLQATDNALLSFFHLDTEMVSLSLEK